VSKVHHWNIDGLTVKTGDVICTTDGDEQFLAGQFWRLIGKFIEGAVDHVAVYVGPEGRCVESGTKGVIAFSVPGHTWDPRKMNRERGPIIDQLYGIAYPLEGRGLSQDEIEGIRLSVADYCLAQVGKGYNLNFMDPDDDSEFYCSQLAYKAYRPYGINLNSDAHVAGFLSTKKIIYPQEIWDGCHHQEVGR